MNLIFEENTLADFYRINVGKVFKDQNNSYYILAKVSLEEGGKYRYINLVTGILFEDKRACFKPEFEDVTYRTYIKAR